MTVDEGTLTSTADLPVMAISLSGTGIIEFQDFRISSTALHHTWIFSEIFHPIGFVEQYQYHTLGPLRCFQYDNATTDLIQCDTGYQVEYKYRCVLEFDERRDLIGCKDTTHIQGCEEFVKDSSEYTKCPHR